MTYEERLKSPMFTAYRLHQQKLAERQEQKLLEERSKMEQKRELALAREHRDEEANRRKLNDIAEKNKKASERWAALAFSYTQKQAFRLKRQEQARITRKLRSRLTGAIRAQSAAKSGATLQLLGCSLSTFKRHIERLFKRGMTWENHGFIWHIDHVKPCRAFNLKNRKEQRHCFSYKNLQPLFIKENLSKGGRWP